MNIQSDSMSWFIKAFFHGSGLRLCGMIFSLLFGMILTRNLGPADYGRYGYFISIISIATIIVQFGIPSLIINRMSGGKSLLSDKNSIINWTLKTIFINSFIFFFVILIACSMGVIDWKISLIIYFSVYFSVLSNLYSSELRSREKVTIGQINEALIKPIFFFLLLFLYFYFSSEKSLDIVIFLNFISVFIGFVFLKKITEIDFFPKNIECQKKGLIGDSFKYVVFDLIKVLSGQIIIIILPYYTTMSEVGLYKISFSLFMLAIVPSTLLASILAPKYAQFCGMGVDEKKELAKMNILSSVIMVVIPIILFIIFFFFGKPIISILFSNEFVNSNNILLVLLFSEIICGFFGNPVLFLSMLGKQNEVLLLSTLSLIVLLISSFILIPIYNAMGAAYSILLSSIVLRVLGFIINIKMFNFDTSMMISLFIINNNKKEI